MWVGESEGVCSPAYGGNTCYGLQAAKIAASALQTIFDYRYMSYFARAEAISLEKVVVEHYARTDTMADFYHDQIVVVLLAAEHILSESTKLAVIANIYGQLIAFLEETAERKVTPIEVHSTHHNAVISVYQARGADANAEQRFVGGVQETYQ